MTLVGWAAWNIIQYGIFACKMYINIISILQNGVDVIY